jgi:predicted ArsR family transcriptional regulator
MLGISQTEILRTLLYASNGVNIDQLSQKLGISRNATYQHVKTLERDGLITGHKVEKTKGRPGQTYRLTREGQATFTQSYAMIASLLVGVIKQRLGHEETVKLFRELGSALAIELDNDLAALDVKERIEKISNALRTLGYETVPELAQEPDTGVPSILAHNCVFHDVAEQHSEVCEMDLALLETLSGCSVEHNECIVRGGRTCRFRFHPTKQE